MDTTYYYATVAFKNGRNDCGHVHFTQERYDDWATIELGGILNALDWVNFQHFFDESHVARQSSLGFFVIALTRIATPRSYFSWKSSSIFSSLHWVWQDDGWKEFGFLKLNVITNVALNLMKWLTKVPINLAIMRPFGLSSLTQQVYCFCWKLAIVKGKRVSGRYLNCQQNFNALQVLHTYFDHCVVGSIMPCLKKEDHLNQSSIDAL